MARDLVVGAAAALEVAEDSEAVVAAELAVVVVGLEVEVAEGLVVVLVVVLVAVVEEEVVQEVALERVGE